MSLEEALFLAIVLLVGLPAGITVQPLRTRNGTALALTGAWFFGWAIYIVCGIGMPVQAMLIADFAVITVIYCKDDWRDCSPYRGWAHVLCSVWLERSPWDRAILAMFPLAWVFYAGLFSDHLRYWALWLIAAAQFLLAGWEALSNTRTANADQPTEVQQNHVDSRWRLAGYGQ